MAWNCTSRLSVIRTTVSMRLPCVSVALSCQRGIRTTSLIALASDLERAKQKLATLKEDPGNEMKLKLYSLFKQVSIKIIEVTSSLLVCVYRYIIQT